MYKMMPCLLYLLSPWIFVHGNNSSKSVYIPEPVYELCSYTDICDRKATRQPEEGYRSCCTPCSCGKDCGLTLDCCFDHLDEYRLVENGKFACLPSGIGGDLSLFHYYYMIIFCNSTSPLKHHVNGTACRIDEDGQSFIAPVSSVNGVYVNAECAECNDIHDYQSWDYIPSIKRFGQSVYWNLKFSQILNFLPPISEKFPSPKVCYDNTQLSTSQSECDDLLFPKTCQDLNSVFLSTPKNNRNVACALCNTSSELDKFTEHTCSKTSTRFSLGSSGLTILLDSSVFNVFNLRDHFQLDTRESSGKTCKPGSRKSLKTVFKITQDGFSPSGMHSFLKSCAENLWKIVIMDKVYTFSANIDKHLHVKDGSTLADGTESEKLYDEIVDRKEWLFRTYGHSFIAKKTFFCYQVFLPSDEVEIKNLELRILATNKTLGENEFTLNEDISHKDYSNVTYAVCVEDYFAHSGVSKLWVNSIYRFVFCSTLLLMIV